ncbi:type II toxin-antitoxin system VapC family toxin [Rhodopseudomonas palustris]|uniref:Ribonuclease VapC n=1 Tax=Rhodopseudomonas palustris (strain BisB18) TaxID=316056 RepID=Q20YW0_RHOPB
MIVLDTNVISELMRAKPDAAVMAWFGQQPIAGVFTTTLTQAEIFYGLALVPEGRRRDQLIAAARPIFEIDLAGRVLPFDTDAADAYPAIAASRRHGGHPISQIDAQIAAIVRSRGARLATRNVADFADCGIAVVDPWMGT